MYQYQKSHRYFAQVADDIKDLAEYELKSLGADETRQAYRGIYLRADKKSMYKINYCSRLINRVLAPLMTFDCHSDKYLYSQAYKIAWSDFLSPDDTFAVFATVTNSAIKHSKYAALRLKDAVVDYFKDCTGRRPSIDTRNPSVWFNLYVENNKAVISVDTSGGSLHRRGYRRESLEAPMAETVAASIIRYSQWDGNTPLVDPFCGAGTLLCEAYMHAASIPASIKRVQFGFERLPDYDTACWQAIRNEARSAINDVAQGLISGSDVDSKAVGAAICNCKVLDEQQRIRITRKDAFQIDRLPNCTIICNPPYGIRMNSEQNLAPFYKRLGDFLKQKCTGSTAYIYFGNRTYLKHIGLKPAWKQILFNGGLDGRLAKFVMY
ncbi:MAG: class I SAM-dependent RNA methyltransferase [Chitinivibrionales bacterium]|nr:class I SAM-dependent RNA methyltransferase [Chitinivibrionales bacterium]